MNALNRVLVATSVGALMTPILYFYAGFADGVSHNSDMMRMFFPYGMAIETDTNWKTVGTLLIFTQFSLYAVLLTMVRPKRWKVVALALIVLIHAAAVAGLR
jgi:hypothetical protein